MGSESASEERRTSREVTWRQGKARQRAEHRKHHNWHLATYIGTVLCTSLLWAGVLLYQEVAHKREVYEIYHEDARECYEIRKNNGRLHQENANLLRLYNQARRKR